MNISLTISQIENLKEFIEFEFIGSIRDDEDIDNIDYIVDMMDTYKKLKEALANSNSAELVHSPYTDTGTSSVTTSEEYYTNGGLQ